MATREGVLVVSFLCIVHYCAALGVFSEFLGETEGCEDICDNTYPLHTYDTALHLSYCHRGCRLFTIIDYVNDKDNLNDTKDACAVSCKEAYEKDEDAVACVVGCDGQFPYAKKRQQDLQQFMMQDSPLDVVYPLLYVHNLYSNMIDKLSHHVSVSWSYYMGSNNGQLIVVRSEPQYILDDVSISSQEADYKTSNYIETNLAAVDNSATPNLRHSQMPHAMEHDMAPLDLAAEGERQEMPNDWLGCIAKKSGIPRLLLSFTIFISAMVMIWLCFTTAATAPEHRISTPQKLSIYGDLDYLSKLDEKSLLASVHPQDRTDLQAAALPIKIKVERI